MKQLTKGQKLALRYHDLFDYPLDATQLISWEANLQFSIRNFQFIKYKNYYCLAGREEIINKRLANEKASKKKLEIAKRAATTIGKIPAIRLVAVSGALAMSNASEESDIDLLLVASPDALWSARPLVYGILHYYGFQVRKPRDKNEKDKLCLNLWMDQSDLKIKEKNIYTAHELAQLIPLVNKDNTYEMLMMENSWVRDYWPNSIKRKYLVASREYIAGKKSILHATYYTLLGIINRLFYWAQAVYMKPKITREQVSLTRAFFHPKDWGKEVEKKLLATRRSF